MELFATATGERLGELVPPAGRQKKTPGVVSSILASSADGRRLAVGVRDWLQVWDAAGFGRNALTYQFDRDLLAVDRTRSGNR